MIWRYDIERGEFYQQRLNLGWWFRFGGEGKVPGARLGWEWI